jgi:hypothetical protein
MKVVDIAQEIYFDLNSPSDLSIAAIAYWVRSNVGALNNLICENFGINDSYEIVDLDNDNAEINMDAASILKKMYMVYRYSVAIRSKITSLDSSDVVMVTDQDTSVRRSDKTQVIRAVTAEKKQEEEELRNLINSYKTRRNKPGQVVGDDIVAGIYPEGYPYIRIGRTYGYTAY